MKIITIEKTNENRSIYDLASTMYDRQIKYRKNCKYAVVLAAYHGGDQYSTHKTLRAAQKKAQDLSKRGFAGAIIDINGQEVDTF